MGNRSILLTTVVMALSAFFYGCVVIDDKSVFQPSALFGITSVDKLMAGNVHARARRIFVDVDVDNGKCKATFETDPDGRVRTNTLQILPPTNKVCKREEPSDKLIDILTIQTDKGPQPIKSVGFAQFNFEGSCRYCWANTNGGMTCIVSPHPC